MKKCLISKTSIYLILTALFVVLFNSLQAQEQPDLPVIDISAETKRHVIIAAGTEDTPGSSHYPIAC